MRDKIELYQDDFDQFISRERHVAHMVRARVARYGQDKIAVRHKAYDTWEALSWATFGERIERTARTLIGWGIGAGDRTGIFSANRIEWSVADIGTLSVRGVSVPIYATNSAEETGFIVKDAGITVLFVGDQDQYDKAVTVRDTSDVLKKIVVFDRRVSIKADADTMYFEDFLLLGAGDEHQPELESRLADAGPLDLATLIYTSGTTGDPKGAMLNHFNLLSVSYDPEDLIDLGEDDVSLAFLPLSHVFERTWTYFVMLRGGENHYCHDVKQLPMFLRESRPMYMCSVPRMWEKIHARICKDLEQYPPLKRRLFLWAMEVGGEVSACKRDGRHIRPSLYLRHALADALVLHKIKDVFGGRVKFFNCGGAAFSAEISEFFFKAGVIILQGYGLTECFCPCIANPQHNKFGTCGPVMPMYEARIADNGEIEVNGPGMMQGYFNKPELTKEVITEDGWLRTGDIGIIDEENYVTVTDRLKDLMKTSGGKYIAPQKLETLLNEDFYIEQSFTVGDGRKFVSALIVPCFESLEHYAQEHGIPFATREELVNHPDIIEFFNARIDELTAQLGRVEKIKKFALMAQEFSQEALELTPTQKIRRKIVTERYKEIIDSFYHE